MKTPELSPYELAFQAESGDPGAQFRLALLFLVGEKVEQDLEAAHRWMAEAARAGHSGAQILVDKLIPFQPGRTLEENSGHARRRFHKRGAPEAFKAIRSWVSSGIQRAAYGVPRWISLVRTYVAGSASAKPASVSQMKSQQKPAPIVDAA